MMSVMKGGLGDLMKQAQQMQENMKKCRSSWLLSRLRGNRGLAW